jgi:FMN phosphatase YigB (HAD superfamily)
MLFRTRFIQFFFLFTLLSSQLLQPIVIIFDLGGVLFATNRWTVAQQIGIWDLFIYKILVGDPKDACFNFLETEFGKPMPINPHDPKQSWLYAMGDSRPLPKIWCEHMKGTLSGNQIIEQVETKLHKYKSGRRKRIIKNFVRTVFNPKILASAMYPIAEGVKLVADCARRGLNKIMILSNFGSDSFEELSNKPESRLIFDHIRDEQHLMISGRLGLLKPDPAIYQEVKRRLIALDERFKDPTFLATNCVFIDDQIENIIGARQAGITALWLADGNYERIREELQLLGAL